MKRALRFGSGGRSAAVIPRFWYVRRCDLKSTKDGANGMFGARRQTGKLPGSEAAKNLASMATSQD
jgi:hypothetical protein